MTDKIKQSKLDSTLGDELIRQSRRLLKFTDYAIERFNGNFINAKGKTQKQIRIAFDVSKNTALKGLKLFQYRRSKRKYFTINYWFNNKSKNISLGEFRPGVFGVKELENKAYEIGKLNKLIEERTVEYKKFLGRKY